LHLSLTSVISTKLSHCLRGSGPALDASNQSEAAETRVPAAANDDVVMQRNAERGGGVDDVSGDRNIRL
jgi:hypothetical protein